VCVDSAVRTESLYRAQVSSHTETANIGEGVFDASRILCWAEQLGRLTLRKPK
jgi:hypothetical protein